MGILEKSSEKRNGYTGEKFREEKLVHCGKVQRNGTYTGKKQEKRNWYTGAKSREEKWVNWGKVKRREMGKLGKIQEMRNGYIGEK